MSVDVNYLAVLLAAVASMIVGSIWYAQSVFGRRWAKLAKIKMDGDVTFGNMAPLLLQTFVASLITAFVLAHLIFIAHNFFGNSWLSDALQTAFWAWLGLTAARIFVHDVFESRPKQLTLITVSHELVTLLAMGAVLGWLHP